MLHLLVYLVPLCGAGGGWCSGCVVSAVDRVVVLGEHSALLVVRGDLDVGLALGAAAGAAPIGKESLQSR